MSKFQQCLDLATTLQSETQRKLRLIRLLDQRTQEAMSSIHQRQTLWKCRALLQDDIHTEDSHFQTKWNQLTLKQKECYGLGVEKVEVAKQLLESIDQTLTHLRSIYEGMKPSKEVEIIRNEEIVKEVEIIKEVKVIEVECSPPRRPHKSTKSRRGDQDVFIQLDMFDRKRGRLRSKIRVIDLASSSTEEV